MNACASVAFERVCCCISCVLDGVRVCVGVAVVVERCCG